MKLSIAYVYDGQINTFGFDHRKRQRAPHKNHAEQVVEFHPLVSRKEWELEGQQKVGWKTDIVGNWKQFQQNVQGKVNFAEVCLVEILFPKKN